MRHAILIRLWPVALAWGLILGLGARPARAAGCHAPERPVLGLSYEVVRDGVVSLDAATPRFDHRPCPIHAQRSGQRVASTLSVRSLDPVPLADVRVTRRFVPVSPSEIPSRPPTRIDRPPRPFLTAA